MMSEVTEQKKELRRLMLQRRNACDTHLRSEYDARICTELSQIISGNDFRSVHVYIPIGSEIDIRPVILDLLKKNVRVVAPKTLPARKLENRILHSLSELETGVMKTLHPLRADIHEGPFDLIIVPGLAFDRRNFRLGYGGGYYDNFLASHPGAMTIGIFYPFQEVENVPVEQHDIMLKRILVG
jgi:5-formyltetrahydrofolate cyclo-ligase